MTDNNDRGGILGAAEHIAHRNVDNIIERLINNLPISTKQFLAKNRSWLVASLDVLATITGFVRPNSRKWDILQTSFSSLVEGLERAVKAHGVEHNVSQVPTNEVKTHFQTFNQQVVMGIFSAEESVGKNVATWISALQANDADLAQYAFCFIGSMSARDLSRFASWTNDDKTAYLKAWLPKQKIEPTKKLGFISHQRLVLGRINRHISQNLVEDKQRLAFLSLEADQSKKVRALNFGAIKKTFGVWSMLKLIPILGWFLMLIEWIYFKIKNWRDNRVIKLNNPNPLPNEPNFVGQMNKSQYPSKEQVEKKAEDEVENVVDAQFVELSRVEQNFAQLKHIESTPTTLTRFRPL